MVTETPTTATPAPTTEPATTEARPGPPTPPAGTETGTETETTPAAPARQRAPRRAPAKTAAAKGPTVSQTASTGATTTGATTTDATTTDATTTDATTTEPSRPKTTRTRSTRSRTKATPAATARQLPLPDPTAADPTAADPTAAPAPDRPAQQAGPGMTRFADSTPEPAETRVSPQLGPTGTGDLSELIRLLIPDDPTTGPVPIPAPAPDTGPLILPPIYGPFLMPMAGETGSHTIPLAYRGWDAEDTSGYAPDDATAPVNPEGADQGSRGTAPTGGSATGETTTAAAERPTAPAAATRADGAAEPRGVAEPDGATEPDGAAEPDEDGFTVVGVLAHRRRGWRWMRWLLAFLPLPARRSPAGRGPFSRHWPRALRWSLDMSWERALRRPGLRRWLPAVDWEETMGRPPARHLLPALIWPSAPPGPAVRRWPTVERSPSRPGWARGDVDRRFTPVYAVAFSPDGRRLATASGDGRVRLWNVDDPGAPTRLWEVSTRFAAGPVVAFSPDGAWLATGHDSTNAVLWEMSELAGPVPRALLTHPGGLTGVHFSADGRRLVATFAAEAARIWDITDPTHPRPLGRAGDSRLVRAAAIFPDGRWLATAGERVEFWEVSATPVRRMHLAAGEGPLFDVAVAPDGRTMAVGRLDGTVDLWHTIDPSAPAPRASIDAHAGWITSVTFGADSRWLATVSAEHVALWDLRDPTAAVGRTRARLPVTAVAFAPGRGLLAVASLDGSVALLRPTTPVSLERDTRPAQAHEPGGANGHAAVRPDEAWAVEATDTEKTEITADVRPLTTLGPTGDAPVDAGIDLPGTRRRGRRTNGGAVVVGGATIGLSCLLVFGHQLGLPPALLLIVGLIVVLALVAALGVALAAAVWAPMAAGPRRAAGADGSVSRSAGRRTRGAHTRSASRPRRPGSRTAVDGPTTATATATATRTNPTELTEPTEQRPSAGTDPLNATLPLDLAGLDDIDMDVVGTEDDGLGGRVGAGSEGAATAPQPVPEPTRPTS
ncbi:WD40 repeat domain-containing protein [Pseudofrankia saprophytica]|uniref:WD40 repeat domain-containing protein n=1 Tax=Pseudofrankia saprophytica TaxID=298655 RepID=UPI0018E32C0A|nr:WD40 repeat domain-containing protein [Pseudofrankia saprophytica]